MAVPGNSQAACQAFQQKIIKGEPAKIIRQQTIPAIAPAPGSLICDQIPRRFFISFFCLAA
jgi:hypothetical protein